MEDKFDINSLTPEELYQKGKDNYLSGELEVLSVTIECFTRCIDVGYAPEDIYFFLGGTYHSKGLRTGSIEDYTKAIKYYKKSIEIGYIHKSIFYWIGNAFYNKGILTRSDEYYTHSIEYYEKSIEISYTPEKIYYFLGLAYLNKGYLIHSVENFSHSIEYLQKSIKEDYTPEDIYYWIGKAYCTKDIITTSVEVATHSIKNLQKSIDKSYTPKDIYYFLGLTYLNKGILTESVEDCTRSIEHFTFSICRDYDKAGVFYSKGLALQEIGKQYEAELDFNSALYQMFNSFDNAATGVINKIENYPYNYTFLTELYASSGVNVSPYFYTYTRDIDIQYDFLLFLDYMKFNAMELSIADGYSIGSASILTYYLGGCLTSYRILDDQDTDELSVQELYYYYRSALDFSKVSVRDIGIADIIEEIENRPSLSDTDKYYLAQIYYLRAMDEEGDIFITKARELFEESMSVIWSKAMIDVIDGVSKYQKDIERYIDTHCKEYKEIDIANIDTYEFWLQFNDFYHFREVNHTKPNFLPKCLFYDDIWNVFKLSGDKEEIADNGEDTVLITDREKLERAIYQEKGYKLLDTIADNMPISQLSRKEFNFIKAKVLGDKNELNVENPEGFAQAFLDKDAYENEEKQILLRYLLQEQKIDKKQYTSLLLYHVIREGIVTEYGNIGKLFELSASIIKSITPIVSFSKYIEEGFKKILSSADKDTNYYDFKDEIWKTVNNMYGHLELKDVDLLKKKK